MIMSTEYNYVCPKCGGLKVVSLSDPTLILSKSSPKCSRCNVVMEKEDPVKSAKKIIGRFFK